VNILFIGDVTGVAGLRMVDRQLRQLRERYPADLVIANAENAAPTGRGITAAHAERLFDSGVEFLTMGNHVWDQREAYALLEQDERIVRPANMHASAPGRGYTICHAGGKSVAILNLIGRTYMAPFACPFETADRLLAEIKERADICLVDFHAEITSEKLAMGWYLAGRATAVVGTHTHVQTADERVLPGGTAYITDVGMTGPRDGILGVRRDQVIRRFLDQMPVRFELADGAWQLGAVYIQVDDSGRAVSIERVMVVD